MKASTAHKPRYFVYQPFDLDGRIKCQALPDEILPGTEPTQVTHSTARKLIEMLQRHGLSNHSPMGSTLWVLIAWCRRQNRVFEVWKFANDDRTFGYCVVLDKFPQGVSQEDGVRVL